MIVVCPEFRGIRHFIQMFGTRARKFDFFLIIQCIIWALNVSKSVTLKQEIGHWYQWIHLHLQHQILNDLLHPRCHDPLNPLHHMLSIRDLLLRSIFLRPVTLLTPKMKEPKWRTQELCRRAPCRRGNWEIPQSKGVGRCRRDGMPTAQQKKRRRHCAPAPQKQQVSRARCRSVGFPF